MDRATFLSALPFLQQETDAKWPPNDACQVILKDRYVLSVEPMSMMIEDDGAASSIGPAFFRRNTTSEDPSLCFIDVAIQTKEPKASSPSSSASTTLGSNSSSSPLPDKTSSAKRRIPAVYWRVENTNVWSVDFSHLRDIQLLMNKSSLSSADDEANNGAKSEQEEANVPLPPCILFTFDSCSFRVFSLDEKSSSENSSAQELQHALSQLQTVPSGEYVTTGLDMVSVTRAATTSYPRYSPFSRMHHGRRKRFNSPPSALKSTVPQPQQQLQTVPDDAVELFKRRRLDYAQSWNGVQSIGQVMDMPSVLFMESSASCDVLGASFGPLLNSTAQQLSQSYINSNSKEQGSNQQQQEAATRLYSQECQLHQQELDRVFEAAFPSPRKHRRLPHLSCTPQAENTSPAAPPIPYKSIEEMVQETKELLEKKKQSLTELHRLALMP